MIARLSSSCHVDSLSTVMDAWQDLSSPYIMHAFMSGCADHEFGVLTPLGDPENVGDQRHDLKAVDTKSLRIKQASQGWKSELDSFRGDPVFVRGAERYFQYFGKQVDPRSSRCSSMKFEQQLHLSALWRFHPRTFFLIRNATCGTNALLINMLVCFELESTS
jgi:hypothetical protein|mmetsp:Transcript_49110/g.77644  ORF Transcript_49110/g.77644 Transcript_49110/m.77644 type:complete len:163 (-) Transcript_49110:88-576(-)